MKNKREHCQRYLSTLTLGNYSLKSKKMSQGLRPELLKDSCFSQNLSYYPIVFDKLRDVIVNQAQK